MAYISKDTFKFLKDLSKNNDRDWFEKNKSRYTKAQDELVTFMEALHPLMLKYDTSLVDVIPKKSVFRIYRDVRFSKDKRPYKTNIGAWLHSGNKGEMKAGYYLHLEPGQSMIAGGAYMPPGPFLKVIRQEIHYNPAPLKKILKSKNFKNYFGEIQGERLKNSPRDYEADHPDIELLKLKSFTAVHMVTDEMVCSEGFLNHCNEAFKSMNPLIGYLNMSLD